MDSMTTFSSRPMRTTVLMAALSSAWITFGTPAAAADMASPENARAVEVTYRDLNLDQREDASKLYWRIERAARVVCDTLDGDSTDRIVKHRACMNEAISNAVAAVNHPNLTQHYASRTRAPATATSLAAQP